MKRLFTILAMVLIASGMFGQSPEKMSYQAVVRNAEGVLVQSSNIGIKISILQGSTNGTVVYTETQSATSNANGLVTLEIGAGTTTDDFSAIVWGNGPYFLKTETDPEGGISYTIIGVSQLISVPYALYAEKSGNSFSGDYNDLANKPFIPVINDTLNSSTSLWSSTKTSTELGSKANSTDIYTKTDLQTSGQAILHYNNISNKPTNLDEDKTNDVTLSGDQTISGNKTFTGIVAVNTPINNTDAVNKDYVDALKNQVEAMNNIILNAGYNGTLIDVEGNVYKTVKIGTQIWMAENLKTKKYNDGSAIPNITEDTTWIKLTTGAYCWFNNNEEAYKNVYGALYNWYAVVDDHNLCPTGWHIPTASEISTLADYLYNIQTEGLSINQMMKDTSSGLWALPCESTDEGTNTSGFTGLPAGSHVGSNKTGNPSYRGKFSFSTYYAFFWLREGGFIVLTHCSMLSLGGDLFYFPNKGDGFSVRCVKD